MTFAEAARYVTTYSERTQMDYQINFLFYELGILTKDEWDLNIITGHFESEEFRIIKYIASYVHLL